MKTHVALNLDALRHNYRTLQSIAPHSTILPVVKSNAYGHGMLTVADALADVGIPGLCVNYLDEVAELRSHGYKGRVVVCGPLFADQLANARELEAEIFLSTMETLRAWTSLPNRPKAHIKFDTGLSRQGFMAQEHTRILACLENYLSQVVGVCTHFANVEDVTNHTFARTQLANFSEITQTFRKATPNIVCHAASSASTLLLPESHLDMCRVGISLYGFWPSPMTRVSYLQTYGKLLELQPVLSFQSELAQIKKLKANAYVGYGCTYRTNRETTVGIVPAGYAEGYPRLAGDRASYVLVQGTRCTILGRICMNMMIVDLTHLESVPVGAPVTLIGSDGHETITAEDVANWADTIQYEIVTRIGSHIPRRISHGLHSFAQ